MSAVQLVKEIIGRLGQTDEIQDEQTWSADAVEFLLADLGITNYAIDFEPRVVALGDLDGLYKVMNHIGKTALSDTCLMSMSKWRRKVRLHAGGWQFEAEDSRN